MIFAPIRNVQKARIFTAIRRVTPPRIRPRATAIRTISQSPDNTSLTDALSSIKDQT